MRNDLDHWIWWRECLRSRTFRVIEMGELRRRDFEVEWRSSIREMPRSILIHRSMNKQDVISFVDLCGSAMVEEKMLKALDVNHHVSKEYDVIRDDDGLTPRVIRYIRVCMVRVCHRRGIWLHGEGTPTREARMNQGHWLEKGGGYDRAGVEFLGGGFHVNTTSDNPWTRKLCVCHMEVIGLGPMEAREPCKAINFHPDLSFEWNYSRWKSLDKKQMIEMSKRDFEMVKER